MKWPGEKKREKLWNEGAQTNGVVVKLWWHSKLQGTYGLEFRVKFPDGSTADVKERFLDASNQGYIAEGAVVPVRFDASDYSQVRLDVPALEAPIKQAHVSQDTRVDAALAQLGQPGAVTGEAGTQGLAALGISHDLTTVSDPEDRLAKLADLRERGALTDAEFAAAKAKILAAS